MNESEIFQAAIKLTPEVRQKFVDAACAGNQQLQSDVKALLREFDEMGSFIDQPAVKDLPTDLFRPMAEKQIAESQIVERPGTSIGAYKLMEQIGEGGFGLVFVAEQQQPVRRKVALKIIKPGMDTREVIARFEAERQALALMDHPNIARVFDAGTTESGRPYFVMELVKGIPITDYCDQQQLTARERLELFLSVCQAVQHAHTKGIIHRDIKPSNILVAPHDGIPVVKVIDFGVAKAIGQQLTDKTIYTRFTQMIGTPLYMSPEQAEINALDVDTRSDVYSLGVLLYELLTGTTPIDRQRLAKAAYDEIRRIIREEEPPKPSTRLSTMGETLSSVSNCRKTEPTKLSALVKGDLDWIVMKALEKDRTRRYETAISFAADVRRFLAEEAIEARPPSSWYRFQKVAKRNRVAIATASLLAATLLMGLAGTTWQAYRASQSEKVARESELKAIAERDAKEQALAKEAMQRNLAEVAQEKAQQERDAAKRAREELRKSLYAASMSLIPAAWANDNLGRVHELLNEQIPKTGEEDLRHFEWHYWNRQSNASRRNWLLGEGPENFVLSENGTRVVGWTASQALGGEATVETQVATFRMLDVETESQLFSAQRHPQDLFAPTSIQKTARLYIQNMSVNHDGSRVACVYALETPTDSQTEQLSVGSSPNVNFPKVDYKTVVYDIASQKVLFEKELNWYQTAISPDGRYLLTCETTVRNEGRDDATTLSKLKVWDLNQPDSVPVSLTADGQDELEIPTIIAKFSPDGSRLALISPNWSSNRGGSSIRIFDAMTGQEQLNQPVSDGNSADSIINLLDLAFSPDGKVLATIGHKLPSRLAFSPNPIRAVRVSLWDCASISELRAMQGDEGISLGNKSLPREFGIAFGPDGKYLAAWSKDESIGSVIDVGSRSIVKTIKNLSTIRSIAFSADATRLVSVGGMGTSLEPLSNGILQEWDIASPADGKTIPIQRVFPGVVVWSADKQLQAFYKPQMMLGPSLPESEFDPEIKISDASGSEVLIFKEHTALVTAVRFSPDGRWLLSTGLSNSKEMEIFLWETRSGKVRWTNKGQRSEAQQSSPKQALPGPSMSRPTVAEFSPDGKSVAFPEKNRVRILALSDLKEQIVIEGAQSFFFSPDSRKLVTFEPQYDSADARVLRDFRMSIWDLGSGQILASHNCEYMDSTTQNGFMPWGMTPSCEAIFSPDSRFLTAVSSSQMALPKSVTFYDLVTGEECAQIRLSVDRKNAALARTFAAKRTVVFSPDGLRVMILDTSLQGLAGSQQGVGVWELPTGKQLYRLEGHAYPIQASAFSADGKRIATTSNHPENGEVKIWDAATGRELLTLTTKERFRAKSISFSPDGHRLSLQYLTFLPFDRRGGPGGGRGGESEIVWDVAPVN